MGALTPVGDSRSKDDVGRFVSPMAPTRTTAKVCCWCGQTSKATRTLGCYAEPGTLRGCVGGFVSPLDPDAGHGQVCCGVARPAKPRCLEEPGLKPNRSPLFTTENHVLSSLPSPTTPCPPDRRIWREVASGRHHQDFAIHSEARQDKRPNRVCLRYGREVHLGLLSTSFHKDAVTFGFQAPDWPGQGLSPCWSSALQGARVRWL